ncbi:hypothetical protein SCB29_13710 [Paraburkholderia sp. SIMBA_055]
MAELPIPMRLVERPLYLAKPPYLSCWVDRPEWVADSTGLPPSPVTLAGVENNNWEDQGQRNAKALMQILGGDAVLP